MELEEKCHKYKKLFANAVGAIIAIVSIMAILMFFILTDSSNTIIL